MVKVPTNSYPFVLKKCLAATLSGEKGGGVSLLLLLSLTYIAHAVKYGGESLTVKPPLSHPYYVCILIASTTLLPSEEPGLCPRSESLPSRILHLIL